jgi:UDP-N-acetylmuramyl pentapeptide phosphotransferase/UDP-N-acetylglucosamine-1-phosphate transferase
MGNSGSHFLGFSLAAIALGISYAPMERKIALFSPLLILGFAIFDTAFLILMRVRKARSIFKKSNDHLALRFLCLGYSKNRALLFMLSLALFFSLSGVALSQVSNSLGIIIIVLVVMVGLALTKKMGRVSIDG